MIFGRPVNLWLGLSTALVGFLTVVAVAVGADGDTVANIAGAGGLFLGAVIALIAGQPPTLNPGDTFKIVTPAGEPNATATVAQPPASSPTVETPPGG